MNDLVGSTIAIPRLILVGLFGAAGFEAVGLWIGEEVLLTRVLTASIFYGALWGVAVVALGLRESFRSRLILGAVFPYIVLIVSVFGIWYIYLAFRQFWIMIPAGVVAALVDEGLYGLIDRQLKAP
jgi:hypothetical protein